MKEERGVGSAVATACTFPPLSVLADVDTSSKTTFLCSRLSIDAQGHLAYGQKFVSRLHSLGLGALA